MWDFSRIWWFFENRRQELLAAEDAAIESTFRKAIKVAKTLPVPRNKGQALDLLAKKYPRGVMNFELAEFYVEKMQYGDLDTESEWCESTSAARLHAGSGERIMIEEDLYA
jgi:hypothetical protein